MADNSSVSSSEQGGSSLPIIIGFVALVLIGGGAFYFYKKKAATTGASGKGSNMAATNPDGSSAGGISAKSDANSNTSQLSTVSAVQNAAASIVSNSGASSTVSTNSQTKESVGEAIIDAKAIKQQVEWSSVTILGHTPTGREWSAAREKAWNSPASNVADMLKKLNDKGYIMKRDASVYPVSDATTIDGNPIGSFAIDKIYQLQSLVLQNKANVSSN